MLYDFTKRLGHILGVASLLIQTSGAFSPRANQPSAPSTSTTGEAFDANDAFKILDQAKSAGIDIDVDINLDKARDFASHYGKFSYEEVEHMRNDLHAHRILNDSPNDILFLERILEDELTSQLKSLKEHMPEPYLFRYPDYHNDAAPSTGLFGSNADAWSNAEAFTSFEPPSMTKTVSTAADEPKKIPSSLFDTKSLLGEGVVESVMICIVLGVLMMAPNQIA